MWKLMRRVLALCAALPVFSANAAITPPAGPIPDGLPPRMLVGLFEQWGGTWMRDSAVPWDVRYAYFTKGWADNWGWGSHDGAMATTFFNEAANANFIPAVQFYQMNGEPGGGEDQFLAKTRNAATMAAYFGDFRLLMQRARDHGRPVIVLLEPDGFAFLQNQSGQNPNAYSAVAATGLPELAGLPDTVAGWGLAFLQLRKSAGATNVVLGIHISGWASGKDLMHHSLNDALQPEVDKVYNFLAPLGLAANLTGATYDLLVGDPLDRDADFYRLTQGVDRWWDDSDSAPINSKSFNRYAEWLRLWNVKSGKRWMLWQIPLGNSNHANVYNNGGPREGYRDNRPEYFFGPNSRAHLEKFASSGVVGLLFGAGAGGQSSYTNDIYTDGRPFMASRAGDFLRSGGLALPAGSSPPSAPAPAPSAPPATHLLQVSSSGTGRVTASAGGIDCGMGSTACSAALPAGATVVLTATAGTNASLAGWSGACSGMSATCTLSMGAARSVTATFAATPPPSGGGSSNGGSSGGNGGSSGSIGGDGGSDGGSSGVSGGGGGVDHWSLLVLLLFVSIPGSGALRSAVRRSRAG